MLFELSHLDTIFLLSFLPDEAFEFFCEQIAKATV